MPLSLDEIEPARFYQIDPAKLDPNHPDQLKKIRILMVSWKTESSITMKYPSVSSLRSHFNGGQNTRRKTPFPALDETHEMDVGVATEVFVKRFEGFEDIKGAFLSSWLSIKNGSCWSALKSSDMDHWAILRKRNGKDITNNKKARSDDLRRNTKNSRSRWSEERYKRAERDMFNVMREKGAVLGKPILRAELRAEARNKIGDTGLLDHLLKHMTGKLAPGGEERFQRRYNADGAMEYWLESTHCIPPPSWQPGNNPSQDLVSAGEIEELRKRIDELERLMKELRSKIQEVIAISV